MEKMFGLQSDCICTVWGVYQKQYSTDLQVSVTHYVRDKKEYVKDFSGFIQCRGDAKDKAISLNKGDKIKITSPVAITNFYQKEKNITYTNIGIMDFELVKDEPKKEESTDFENIAEGVDIEVPFE